MRRVGIYVDCSNIGMNGGHRMRYDVLRKLACRGNGEPQRLNVYVSFDQVRADGDPEYAKKARAYQNVLREQGFRVSVKNVSRYINLIMSLPQQSRLLPHPAGQVGLCRLMEPSQARNLAMRIAICPTSSTPLR